MDQSSSQEIVIRPDQRLMKGAWVVALLAVWLTAGLSLAGEVFKTDASSGLQVWIGLGAWAAALAVLILSFAWVTLGAQVMLLDRSELRIEHRIGTFTIGRPRTYAKREIQKMRIEQSVSRYKGKTVTRNTIVFQYRGATEGLFAYLSRQRAESLLSGPLRDFTH